MRQRQRLWRAVCFRRGHGDFGTKPPALEPRAQAETRRVETLAFLLIPAGALKGAGLAPA